MAGTCPENAPLNCTQDRHEPLFWMHHAMVDKVWYDWQGLNPENAKSFFGGSVQALQSVELYEQYPNGAPPFQPEFDDEADGMFRKSIDDVMDTTSGILCYVYE
ncbi:hypothetical protein EI94DRAFT_1745386 [Lactarius quietus]|nr:hypothetical protein EI94DRAFT_1745386 [Lactarius quietus]